VHVVGPAGSNAGFCDGTAITINDTAPTADAYNLSLVEVKPVATPPNITSLTPASGDWYVSYDYRYRIWNHARREHSNFRWNICDRDCLEQYEHCCHGSQCVALGAVPVVVSVPGAGTSNSATFTVVSPLTISALISPLPNANNWNNTNVTVSYACSGGVPPVQCRGIANSGD